MPASGTRPAAHGAAAWWEAPGAGRSSAGARAGDGVPPQARQARGGAPGEAGALAAPGPRHAAPSAQEPAPQRGHGTPGPGSGQEAGRWRRIVLGTPAAHVEPKPPPADPYRPDTVFDGWSTPHLTVRLASVRGDAHRFGGRPRQDDVVVAWHEPTGTVVFAVADGVSSARLSHVGAALACRTAVNDLLVQLGEDRPGPDWSRVLKAAAYQLLMRVAHGREPSEADRAEAVGTLATTLVTGTVTPLEGGAMRVTVIRAGDSSAWCLQGGRYAPLLHDEDTGSDEISSTAVVALPRLSARSRPLTYTLPADGVLLVGTDGFGVPLGDGTGLVGELFAEGLTVPPPEPRTLAHLLDFSRETFDDDRTLLAIWPRHRLPGGTR
ncbi:protein phosphatase 2C domain-containing protein [Streptomyces sp. NPDC002076]